jgi:G3E family GTPase
VALGINPLATVIALADPEQRAQQALGADPAPPSSALASASLPSQDNAMATGVHPAARGLLSEPGSAHPRVQVMQGEPAAGLSWDAFAAWVDDLSGLLGDRLLRFKAVLRPEGCTEALMLQGVGATFSAPTRAGAVFAQLGERPSIIVIARDVDGDEVALELPDAPVTLRVVRSRRALFA